MLPASDLTEILANLSALNLQPTTTAQILAAVLAPLLRSADPDPPAPSDPSTIVNRTVAPRRARNADLREREYLTPKEVDRLQDAARKHSRYGHRDATAILIAYRHGLRASELCKLTWNMIELDSGRIHVRRAKNGVDSTHPLTGKEIRALRQLRRENLQSRYVFNTERGGPVTRAWFLKMVRRTGELAKLPLPSSSAHAAPWLRFQVSQ